MALVNCPSPASNVVFYSSRRSAPVRIAVSPCFPCDFRCLANLRASRSSLPLLSMQCYEYWLLRHTYVRLKHKLVVSLLAGDKEMSPNSLFRAHTHISSCAACQDVQALQLVSVLAVAHCIWTSCIRPSCIKAAACSTKLGAQTPSGSLQAIRKAASHCSTGWALQLHMDTQIRCTDLKWCRVGVRPTWTSQSPAIYNAIRYAYQLSPACGMQESMT